MWNFHREKLADRCGLRFSVDRGSQAATFADVVSAWQGDPAFCSQFSEALASAPYPAFRWETPPVTNATRSLPFEFVLVDSPELERPVDADAFAAHFGDASESGVVAFPNLGGDAIMVVPCPIAPPGAYGHLAAFVRNAPGSQQQALWQTIGEVMAQRIGDKPVWLNTAGAGVSWLHVRLDDRPKYYCYAPYRQLP